MAKGGIELATEWVTILPETAELTKRLKNFKPEPIHIPVSIVAGSGAQTPQKQGAAVGKAIDKGVVSATKDTGQKVGRNVAPESKPVEQAAQKAGKTIQDEVVKKSKEAGKKAGEAIAEELEKQKGKVAAASQKVADARRAEENIGSRIRASEQKIQQARQDTAKKGQVIASEEAGIARLRVSSEEDAANKINAAERRVQTLRDQRERQMVRLSGMEEAHGRLINTQATTAGRTAKATQALSTEEAALASAIAAQNRPLEDQQENIRKGQGSFGKMSAALVPLGKQLLVTSGLFTGAMGVGGGITYVFKTGNEFVDTMNRMQGITSATTDEMSQLNQKARDLGRDFWLPATSANDAAIAMLELTKAGFTVQEAMDAARGSLQLSAAADVTAAEAAKITGTSLNAFGLEAKESARVTDILANAANMFPGEMQDFAYSLSQGGAVAKSFGIDIEDTTTALGFLAQAGIKSSDAGTLIKTMLLSLTDQGKPAQAAIKDLGLELYDQEGKFRGLEYVYKRLTEASKTMTQEQYQAATQTLFGTDAARFAGVAAGKSAEEWDKFRSKIGTTGTAAKVADARMQGLPGAIERMKNAVQSIALTIYDYVKDPITAVVNAIAAVILKFDDWLSGPIMGWMAEHKEELLGIAGVLLAYPAALLAIKVATSAWAAAQWVLNAALSISPIGLIVAGIALLVGGLIYAYKNFGWFKTAVDAVWGWIKSSWPTVVKVFQAVWEGIKTGISWFVDNVWKPSWEAVKAVWKVVWFALQVGFKTMMLAIKFLGNVVMGLYQDYFKPAFQMIVAVGKIMWEKLKIYWEGIKTAIAAVWDWLQPIIEPFKDFFKNIGDMGAAAGEAIKTAWGGVWDILKMPLHGLGALLAGLPDSVLGVEIPFVADLRNWGKSLQGLAVGGIAGAKIKGPGTGTSDSILGINAAGVPVARVSNGEGVVPADALTTPLGRMLFGALLNLPGLATGGVIGQFMNSVTGRPYAMGGFGPEFDCSGLVSAMVNVAMGRSWNQGPMGGSARTSTSGEGDWLLSQGFVAGMGGPGTLRVGFKNGGPGGGHTAGTLPDGTNFESTTPGGVRFGSGASGADDSQFDQHFFLPPGPQLPGMNGQPGSIGAQFMGAGSGAYGPMGIYGGGAGSATSNKKVREAQDRVEDRTRQLEVAKQRLEEYLEKQRSGKNVKQSTVDAARNQVEKFTREREQAQADLVTAQQGALSANGSSKRGTSGQAGGTGQQGWDDVGKMIFSGFLESFGLDGSVFANLFNTPTFKSAMAGVNFLGGLLGGGQQSEPSWTGGGGGDTAGGLGNLLGGMSDVGGGLIAGVGDVMGVDIAPNGGAGDSMGGGQSGPAIQQDFSGSSFGYNKDEFNQYQDDKQASVNRRYPNLVAGGP